jgi:hypothetical protein
MALKRFTAFLDSTDEPFGRFPVRGHILSFCKPYSGNAALLGLYPTQNKYCYHSTEWIQHYYYYYYLKC